MKRLLFILILVITGLLLLRWSGWATVANYNHALVVINQSMVEGQSGKLAYGQALLPRPDNGLPVYHQPLVTADFDADNLVTNGRFHFYTYGWQMSQTAFVSDENPLVGELAAFVTFANQDMSFYHLYQKIDVAPLHCYELQAWLQIHGNVDRVALEVWDGPRGYQYWYGGRTSLLTGPLPWTQKQLTFCTPADVVEIQIRLRRFGGQGQLATGTIWLDDVRLERVDLAGERP